MNNSFETFVLTPEELFKLEKISEPKLYKMYIMLANFYLEKIFNLLEVTCDRREWQKTSKIQPVQRADVSHYLMRKKDCSYDTMCCIYPCVVQLTKF